MSKLKSKSVKNSFLKDAAPAAKEYNFSASEFAGLQTIDMPNVQEIEERISKSFLAIDAFTPELRGGSGTGSSGSGSGSGSW